MMYVILITHLLERYINLFCQIGPFEIHDIELLYIGISIPKIKCSENKHISRGIYKSVRTEMFKKYMFVCTGLPSIFLEV